LRQAEKETREALRAAVGERKTLLGRAAKRAVEQRNQLGRQVDEVKKNLAAAQEAQAARVARVGGLQAELEQLELALKHWEDQVAAGRRSRAGSRAAATRKVQQLSRKRDELASELDSTLAKVGRGEESWQRLQQQVDQIQTEYDRVAREVEQAQVAREAMDEFGVGAAERNAATVASIEAEIATPDISLARGTFTVTTVGVQTVSGITGLGPAQTRYVRVFQDGDVTA
jgi:predicted  nucleic acid-binding Zn-ribbon protein